MRLEAVPELGHLPSSRPARGEICVRGPANFACYYKAPDLTAEAVDGDGFFHTGDIGELTPDGCLKIIDRKKNIFKLSQGEYVAVEFLESQFGKCEIVEQVREWLCICVCICMCTCDT
jgi:long-chain acyl-CoA synthetase